ncbi:MAG: tRNA pseudouridine(55) synthase TruB [Muribaculaceae bacterium]|nr:tRNA pseudouridine(55) synthase TruB [Muribaculaceae bacterium]
MDYFSGTIFYIDKPIGWTSFDAVKRLRSELLRKLKVQRLKVGHAGTLDPLASGVMVIVTGRFTRRIEELQAGVKEYVATIQLGATTPSYDLETEIDATYPTDHITRAAVEETLTHFVGTISQVPPAYSACKIDGVRAYSHARQGNDVNLKPKTLVIDEIELLDCSLPQITIRVVCSKGTYIRALARDIGEALGSGAHLTALRRTRVGDINESECLTIPQAVEMIRNSTVEYPDWYEGKRLIPEPQNSTDTPTT